MRILVTGSYGFIGYHLAVRLYEEGHEVYLIDNFLKNQDTEKAHQMYEDFIFEKDVHHFDIDLVDFNDADDALLEKEFDIVFHLAAINGTENFYRKSSMVIENNFLATMNTLKKIRCKKFVFASSCEAYASTVNKQLCNIPTDENVLLSIEDIFNPRWSYGGSKILEELFVKNYCTEKGIDFLILRYHNIYGIRDSLKHVIPAIFNKIVNTRFDFVFVEGNCTRSFLYVKDCVEYTIKLARDCKNDVFNVGIEEEVSIKELTQKMLRMLGYNKSIKILDAPKGSVLRRCPDMQKTINAIGFKPKYDLDKGLSEMIEFYKTEGFMV